MTALTVECAAADLTISSGSTKMILLRDGQREMRLATPSTPEVKRERDKISIEKSTEGKTEREREEENDTDRTLREEKGRVKQI